MYLIMFNLIQFHEIINKKIINILREMIGVK